MREKIENLAKYREMKYLLLSLILLVGCACPPRPALEARSEVIMMLFERHQKSVALQPFLEFEE